MILIIAGPRDYFDEIEVERALHNWISKYGVSPTMIVTGEATGVDTIGKKLAKRMGIPFKGFPANWTAYGPAAGPIRNREMAAYAGVHGALLAIVRGKTRGTADMIKSAWEYNLATIDIHDVTIPKQHPHQ